MITLNELMRLAFAVGLLCQGYWLYRAFYRKEEKKPKRQRARAGRDLHQAGRDLTIQQGNPELFYYMQAKDLQGTVDKLLHRLDGEHQMNLRLMDKIEKQQEVIDGLTNEVNKLNYERYSFPVLNLKEVG